MITCRRWHCSPLHGICHSWTLSLRTARTRPPRIDPGAKISTRTHLNLATSCGTTRGPSSRRWPSYSACRAIRTPPTLVYPVPSELWIPRQEKRNTLRRLRLYSTFEVELVFDFEVSHVYGRHVWIGDHDYFRGGPGDFAHRRRPATGRHSVDSSPASPVDVKDVAEVAEIEETVIMGDLFGRVLLVVAG